MRGITDRRYIAGVLIMLVSGSSLADHITEGVDAFPISAVFLGIGIALCLWSYRK